ncbi:MAG: hypothetical protein ABSF44_15835 [Candidatus Bathyarchaeia archaeon]|jgi:hypothetical protein
MGKLKKKSPKKLSIRERQKMENSYGAEMFGEVPPAQKFAFANEMDKFIRASTCRHMQSLGSPCESFDANAEGKCKRDGQICDLLTEKGERYMREYE